jgi:hypothetical protein
MGEVYEARDLRLNRIVALKVLPATAASETERRERFEREAQAVAALNHPGSVTIHSVEQAEGQFFLTMELVDRRPLSDAMLPGGMPLDRLLKIAIPVADAMAAAHQKGITHRETNDLGSYVDVSLTAARDSFVTTKTDRRVAIWVSDGSGTNPKEVVPATQSSGTSDYVTWAGDRLLFTSTSGGHRSISSVSPDDGTAQEIVTQAAFPTTTADGRTVVFRSTHRARQGLWKMTDGGRPARLWGGSTNWPSVARDDRSVVFIAVTGGLQTLWTVSIAGGSPVQLTKRFATGLTLSPDGKTLGFGTRDDQGRAGYAICNLPDCASIRLLPPRADGSSTRIAWAADSGLLYVAGTPQNLWVEPLDGRPRRQLTHFTDDRQSAAAAFSRDGTRLAIARTTQTSDIVLFRGLKR